MPKGKKIRTREEALAAMKRQREYQREYHRKYSEEHKEKLAEQKRQWAKNNPEKNRESSARHYEKMKREHAERVAETLGIVPLEDKLDSIDEMLKKEEEQC